MWPNNINLKIKIVTTIPPKTPHDPCRRLSKRYWGVVICFILFVNQEQGLKIRQLWCRSLNYQIHLHQDNFLLLHLNLVFAHIIIICQRYLRVFFLKTEKENIEKERKMEEMKEKNNNGKIEKRKKLRTLVIIPTLNLLESRRPRPSTLFKYFNFE